MTRRDRRESDVGLGDVVQIVVALLVGWCLWWLAHIVLA